MSLNFTGELKKRTVNLGGGFRQNRSNLLQQTQKERERRERERQKERSQRTIKKAVQRRIDLLHFKCELAAQWPEAAISDNPHTINSIVFCFNCFFADTYTRNARSNAQLSTLSTILNSTNPSELTCSSRNGLSRTIRDTIPHINVHKDDDLANLRLLLEIAQILCSPPDQLRNTSVHIIPSLTNVSLRLSEDADYSLMPLITTVVNMYAQFEVVNYLSFLSSLWLVGLPGFEVNYDAICSAYEHGLDDVLDIDMRLQVLSNLIDLCLDYNNVGFVSAITYLVSKIEYPLITRQEDALTSVDSPQTTLDNQKLITESIDTSLRQLYARDFISTASTLLKGSRLFPVLFASLLTMKPNLKSTLLIYMIPSIFEPLLEVIFAHDVFNKFSVASESSLFSASTEFLSEVFVDNADFVKNELFLFLELLQYRLIITNDFELLNDHGFTKEKFYSLAMFLKKFVFNLVCNESRIKRLTSSVSRRKIETLSILSTKVLSQTYLKDTRLRILPKGSWLVDTSRLSLDRIPKLVYEYEEKKNDVANNSEGEGELYLGQLSTDQYARMQIFLKAPFFISFERRVEIFQTLISLDQQALGFSNMDPFFRGSRQVGVIRREHVLEDAFESFGMLGSTFKGNLLIKFKNQYGEEQGIDGGGITKEFLTAVVDEGFKGLFTENYNHELYPNPEIGLKYQFRIDSGIQVMRLKYVNFLGKIIGKCLYERTLVDVTFAPFFLTKLNTDYKNSFDDMKSLDPELYNNLVKLLTLSEEELEGLNLTFSVDERIDNKTITIDLIPSGQQMPVTTANRLKFIHEMSDYKLNKLISIQSSSFLNGLYEIISKDWLAMFNPDELQLLISGETDVNVDDLKDNTKYGGYDEDDETIVHFWEIVREMTNEERFQLVKFVTSVPRAPLLGFKALNPMFGIRNTGSDVDMLPTSSTCVNLLKLPNYKNKEVLRSKLLYAIKADAGFDLQ